MNPANRTFNASSDPCTALASLGEGLIDDLSWLKDCKQVHANDIPSDIRSLLVHNRHMTATLNAHYGQPVALRVLRHVEIDATYRRMIMLTVDAGERVVEFGLVRLNLDVFPPDARNDVAARQLPLGEILAKYDVLTRVEPRWYLRFAATSPVVQYFAPGPTREAYGRLGVIHCNGRPAVELLEVVPA